MSDIFNDISMDSIDKINLMRQTPGRRGPGSLVEQGLPPYTDAEELIGLCEELGPGRYKAIALDGKGKPLGPAWSYEVQEPPAEPTRHRDQVEQDFIQEMRKQHQQEIDELKARHKEELDDLRDDMRISHETEMEVIEEQLKKRSEAQIEMAELEAKRAIQAADRMTEEMQRRSATELGRMTQELERASMRMERLEGELESRASTILSGQERLSSMQAQMLEERVRLSERIQSLESQLASQTRIHEAELREVRNGDPSVNAAIVRAQSGWEIERSKILLEADLAEKARQNGLGAYLSKLLESDEVQSALFPLINLIAERVFAEKSQQAPTVRAQQTAAHSPAEVVEFPQGAQNS